MPQTLDGLRISSPDIVYARLDVPTSTDVDVVIVQLGRLFDITASGTLPSYDRRAKEAISDAMIEDPSGIILPAERPIEENAERIFNLAINFPWLRRLSDYGSRLETVYEDEFWGMFQDHTVDDYPGLFGVTLREARILRTAAGDPGNDLHSIATAAGLYEQEAFK